MKHVAAVSLLIAVAAGSTFAQPASAPLVDCHQHLFSPAAAALVSPPTPGPPIAPITAEDLVKLLDAAGIKRALVLSVAYTFSNPARGVDNDYERVRAENDWTSKQVARFPDRLRGFCGLNPLKAFALEELARCSKDPQLHYGVKLHFGNSVIDYHNPAHIDQLRKVFRAANEYRMAIVVHMRASISQKVAYGREEARIFLDELVPAAPDIVIQIAHLAGAGGYADLVVDQALSVFVDAIQKRDPRAKNLYFEVTSAALPSTTPEQMRQIATRVRQLGVERVLYGSDAATGGNLAPREAWALFRRVPLTEAEFKTIENNVPPYMR